MSYEQVTRELQAGTPAELICTTCPWSRPCIEPPAVSRSEIDRQLAQATAKVDSASSPKEAESALAMTLVTAMMYGGRDTAGQLCPVFALRFTGPDGRKVSDALREQMRSWGEPS